MGNFTTLINTWLSNRRIRKIVRDIEKNNELRRNITRYAPSEIEGFIERDQQVGSYVISGGHNYYRSRAAASIAACSLYQGIPVVVIHEGNFELEKQIAAATDFTGNKVIISKNTSVYDPFYNRTNQEICNLIINSAGSSIAIGAIGRQYINGIAEFIKSKNIPPYCYMFVTCPHDVLFEKIDEAHAKGYITDQKATQIRNLIMQGQTERANIQSFFSQLSYQGTGILSDKANRNKVVNIKTAVSHNGMFMIDIGSSTNDILLSLLVNEIKEVLASGKKIMLILDGINITTNETLSKVIKSLSSRCLTALVADDVYSMLGAEDTLFNLFTANACKCIVFSHPIGVSGTKWSEVFGYYDVYKVSQNLGNNLNYHLGYSFTTGNSINISSAREFIVKPEELARMNSNEVYILDRNAKELAHAMLL